MQKGISGDGAWPAASGCRAVHRHRKMRKNVPMPTFSTFAISQLYHSLLGE